MEENRGDSIADRSTKKHRIMIVDDDRRILNALRRELRRQGDWDIETYETGTEALKIAQVSNFDLFISDYRMPDMNGVEFLSAAKELQPDSSRIILSGYTDLSALLGAINQAEIYRFISKPWNEHELKMTVQQALDYRDMRLENLFLAKQVRAQKDQLNEKDELLNKLEQDSPGITKVNWSADGEVILSDEDGD